MITGVPDSDRAEGGDTAKESESSQSKAWIAGVVIGCLVAGGAVAGLGFWLGRRRKTGPGGEDPQKGFILHSSALLRSGRQPGGQTGGEYYARHNENTQHSMPHGQAVAVSDGVEMEGSYGGYYNHYREKGPPMSPQEAPASMSIELPAESVHKKKAYV
jgi:hypothetical protein